MGARGLVDSSIFGVVEENGFVQCGVASVSKASIKTILLVFFSFLGRLFAVWKDKFTASAASHTTGEVE